MKGGQGSGERRTSTRISRKIPDKCSKAVSSGTNSLKACVSDRDIKMFSLIQT